MVKRGKAVPIPERHANKYFSYREAWVRIKKAQGYGFYLEAITLEESIITDRLVSYLVWIGEFRRALKSNGRALRNWSNVGGSGCLTRYRTNILGTWGLQSMTGDNAGIG